MKTTPRSKTDALPAADAVKLAEFTRANGERGAAERLGIHPITLARAIAGLQLQRVTVALLQSRLRELAAPMSSQTVAA